MKRRLLSVIVALLFAFATLFCGCSETHTHTYTQRNTEERFLKQGATCEESAVYYYSCSCGEASKETFTFGKPLGHSFTDYVDDNNESCTQDGTCTATCNRCSAKDTIVAHGG